MTETFSRNIFSCVPHGTLTSKRLPLLPYLSASIQKCTSNPLIEVGVCHNGAWLKRLNRTKRWGMSGGRWQTLHRLLTQNPVQINPVKLLYKRCKTLSLWSCLCLVETGSSFLYWCVYVLCTPTPPCHPNTHGNIQF